MVEKQPELHILDDLNGIAEDLFELYRGDDTRFGTFDIDRLRLVGDKVEMKDENDKGPRDVKRPPTAADVLAHLEGRRPIGIWPARKDGMTRRVVIDIDGKDVTGGYRAIKRMEIVKQVEKLGLPLVDTESKSGGVHLDCFLTEWVAQARAYALGRQMATRLGFPKCEIFPPESGPSNWVILPYLRRGNRTTLRCYRRPLLTGQMELAEFRDFAKSRRVSIDAAEAAVRKARPDKQAADGPARAKRDLEAFAAEIAGAVKGTRADLLNKRAFQMGTYVGAKWIEESEARDTLMRAAERCGLSSSEANGHISNGLRDGKTEQPWGDKDTQADEEAVIINAADVQTRRVDWLWRGRLARGKIAMLSGPSDLGKSFVSNDIAARIGRGGDWPLGTLSGDGTCKAKRGRVLILSAEDDIHDTIVPRLQAAGADLSMVNFMPAIRKGTNERVLDLSHDLELVAEKLRKHDDYALVIIDPISAYMDQRRTNKTSANSTNDVRGFMAPVKKLAEDFGLAILCIHHPRKTKGGEGGKETADQSMSGSYAWRAFARVHLIAGWEFEEEVAEEGQKPKKEKTGRALLVISRASNLAPREKEQTLVYELEEVPVHLKDGNVDNIARVRWAEIRTDITDDDVVALKGGIGESTDADNGKRAEETDRAKALLLKVMDGKPTRQAVIDDERKKAGISFITMQRAKKELRLLSKKEKGKDGGWWWIPFDWQPDLPLRGEDEYGGI